MYVINFFKNNFFNDFLLKLIFKKYMINVYIYLAFFFAEKYIIEINTRYIYNWFILFLQKNIFIQILSQIGFLTFGILLNLIILF